MSNDLLRPDEAAALLGYSCSTLGLWRRRGQGPAFIRTDAGRIFYRRSGVEAWLEQRTVTPGRQS
ncbi:helix-turn-helix transcriptional regulator [Rhodococcus koreensis]|uniref:helix-turn-helix transcriptional regulator n=1 Tax=Rhodococcus koreensis TaxID=99653 RepID=UPI00366D54F5